MPFSGRTLNRVVDDVMDETAIRRVINDTWVYIIWVHGRNTSRVALNDQRIEQKTIISGCKTAKKSNANSCFTNTCTMKISCTGSTPRVSDSQFHTSPHAIEHVVSYHISGSLELAFSPSSVTMRRCSKDFNRLVGANLVFSLAKWHFKRIG